MIIRDWRDADPSDTQALYAREQEFWVRELSWDASNAWREIEQARVTWGLPGFLAFDDNRTLRGWAYFLPEGETVHLGGIVSSTTEVTAALLDACLESATRAPRPARISCFLPSRAEGFASALATRGFTTERYRYLRRAIVVGEGRFTADPWRDDDLRSAAMLLRQSYGNEGRHFAPRGTLDEWEEYVRSLVERPGCGLIEPAATRVVHGPDGLHALVLATRIAPGTLHLPQVAVHPAWRRKGLALRLVEEACHIGASRGARQATLLVSEHNAAACQLYAKMGFADQSEFIAATLTL